MEENIHIVNLATYEHPELVEDRKDEWVLFGDDHTYFDWLIERYRKSTTNNSIINNMARLIYGRGVHAIDASRKPNEYANMMALFSKDCIRNVGKELKLLGNAAFQVIYNKQHTKIVQVAYIPMKNLAAEKCNEDGEVEAYYYCEDWSDTRKYEPKRIPAFGYSKEDIEIFHLKPFTVGMKYYATVDYEGGLPYCVLEEEIADFLINTVQNSFSGTKVVNFNNGVPSQEEQRRTKDKVVKKLTGAKGEKVIISFNHDETKKTTIDDVPLDDAPEHYSYVSTEAQQKILNAHNVISPMIVGVVTENNGFSSNADEIEIAAKYFYNIAVRPFQDIILEAMDEILAFNGIALDLYFRRLNLLESVEEKEQQQESVSFETHLESHLEAFLDKYGEDIGEDWELIDEREVDYEQEAHLDAQVKEWESDLKKESVLSKLSKWITELAGTGVASPNRPSEQDREIDGFYFKVRYKYTGSEAPERPFCKAMMRANKLYRKEDIENLNSELVNPGHGHNGEAYNIFLWKGGVSCHHKWMRQTYVSTRKNASIGSQYTNQISTNKGQKFGYRVDNPSEVAQMPKDMPNNGHHPEYGK